MKIKLAFIISFTGLILFNCFFRIFTIHGDSMKGSLDDGIKVIALKYSPLLSPFKQFRRGDKVFFSYASDQIENLLVKTIVGLPGDTCIFIGTEDYKKFIIKNKGYQLEFYYDQPSEQYFDQDRNWVSQQDEQKEWLILKEKYFVLGDNHYKSFDSRELGPIAPQSIKAKFLGRLHWSNPK
ncbi:MAG: signal peptidase I [Bacteroidota bacterium]